MEISQLKLERTSWDEEHKAFTKRARGIRLGDRWTLGIYQDIPDDTPPETRLKDNSFYEFLVPEQHLSLKLFFDNLRNYGICAAFAALGAWLWLSSRANVAGVSVPPWLPLAFAIACWSLVSCLLFLNVLQTWMLSNELFRSIRTLHISRIRVYGPSEGRFHATLAIGHMLGSLFVDWLILLAIRLFALTLVALCVSFVAYAVLVSPTFRSAS